VVALAVGVATAVVVGTLVDEAVGETVAGVVLTGEAAAPTTLELLVGVAVADGCSTTGEAVFELLWVACPIR
jgi:hypothetical protein